ncbi:hypothetical protein Zmor_013961 [Zophobas morio]|uniref:AD domain-containing protein n=1 Tax=Zophobas morio TaxID=2755281 RepID=A0AA38IGH8_9CUCU|nr:hypothetical protein Zmor_013961 [Zophobas morio]
MAETILNGDILYLKNLIGRTVSVETVDNQTHIGTVYVVDPVYKTVVLINTTTNRLELILSHAMKSFNVFPDTRNEDFLRDNVNNVNPEDFVQKKLKLTKWLKHMFLDVKEDGDTLRVEDHLIIGPPYGKSECMCDNTIVLERIRNIIDLMPADFK